MLSGVLRSKRAVEINVSIMRAFVRLREILATHEELARKVAQHDRQIAVLFEHVKNLLEPPPAPPPPSALSIPRPETLWGVVFHIPVVPKCPKMVRGWPYHRNRDFLMVGKSCEQGKALICPCSLRLTRLSQSEKVGDPSRGCPTGSNPRTPARSRAADPDGMKLAERRCKSICCSCRGYISEGWKGV